MPGLLIEDFPPELHRRLKEEAERYHRSITRQALVLLEQALSARRPKIRPSCCPIRSNRQQH